jgi:DivIVA domain-containing protein
MNSASIAETHRFGRVRKNGYDPAEVDAVIARLVEALRHNDERIDMLTQKIDAADGSADAIRKTFVAAESTREAIIDNARVEASAITESAVEEAAELAATAEGLQAEIAAGRDRILTGLFEEAEERMLEIERQMAKRSVEAEWVILEATRVRDQKVSDTEADVAAAKHQAELDADQIRARIATMSQAALAFEKAAETLAASAKERAKVIDLTAMEQLNEPQFVVPAPTVEVEPETAVVDEPLVAVADIPDETETEDIPDSVDDLDDDSETDLDDEYEDRKTRYQRTTGVPLKERIKIARMSG